jgi:hypothetical protein
MDVCADVVPIVDAVTEAKPLSLPPRVPVPPAEKKPKSPWASINDVLIQNRCWLCLQTFPRGKMKKVFQVSDLLTFYHNHMQRLKILKDAADETQPAADPEAASAVDTSGAVDCERNSISGSSETTEETAARTSLGTADTDFAFISDNLQKCYDSYVELMNAGDGTPTKLFEEFRACDVEVWMSGLVCAGPPACKQEAAYFIEATGKHTPVGDGGARKREVNSMFSFAVPKGTECPPGCGCDNPWPFMP